MIRRAIMALLAAILTVAPAMADERKPAVIVNGRVSAMPSGDVIDNGPATNNWWVDAGGKVVWFPDRLMVGDMKENAQTAASNVGDWLDQWTTAQAGASNQPGSISTFASLTTHNPRSGIGILGGAQSLYVNYDAAVVGIAGFCNANRSDYDVQCFGGYLEANLTATAKAGTPVNGLEIDVSNYKASYGAPHPYSATNANALRLACGSGYTVTAASQYPCPSALTINANPTKFEAGIGFVHGSLTTQLDGFQNALVLDKGMAIRQYNSSGNVVGYDIYNTDADAAMIGTVRGEGFWCVADASLAGQFCVTQAGATIAHSYTRPALMTVAALASADGAPQAGDMVAVSDATACTANSTVTGGGSTTCALVYSGAAWKALVTH